MHVIAVMGQYRLAGGGRIARIGRLVLFTSHKASLSVGEHFRVCPGPQGQLQKAPSALQLIPDPACSLVMPF